MLSIKLISTHCWTLLENQWIQWAFICQSDFFLPIIVWWWNLIPASVCCSLVVPAISRNVVGWLQKGIIIINFHLMGTSLYYVNAFTDSHYLHPVSNASIHSSSVTIFSTFIATFTPSDARPEIPASSSSRAMVSQPFALPLADGKLQIWVARIMYCLPTWPMLVYWF